MCSDRRRTAVLRAVLSLAFLFEAIRAKDPDVGMDMIEIVSSHGYPIEEHYVETDDGYILGAFRIPHGRNTAAEDENQTKPAVILQHGLLDSSFTWVNNLPSESLGFILADAGFDVWLGNSRGNTWSKRHVSLSPTSKEFWDFTFDEMAAYDLPALFDYVLNETGHEKVAYVGHSQGTIQAFAGFGASESLSEKVSVFVALGPVIVANHCKSPVFDLLVPFASSISTFLNIFGYEDFLPSNTLLEKLDPALCSLLPSGCNVALFLVAGPTHHTNATRIPVYVSETPAGTSTRNMLHWAQIVHTGDFKKFDYGCGLFSCENKKKYGSKTPPSYSVTNFSVPTYLYYGSNDLLADPTDVQRIISDMPKDVLMSAKEIDGYAHLDFTWAQDANTIIYSDVIENLRSHV